MNTDEHDAEAARAYADRYDLPFEELDWGSDLPTDTDEWTALFSEYGFRYRTAGGNRRYFESFAHAEDSPALVMSGYAFGTVSNYFYWEQESVVPITLEDVVTDHFTHVGKFTDHEFSAKGAYIAALVDQCRAALERMGRPVDRGEQLSLPAFVEVIQLLNGRPQSAYVNLGNEFSFHLAPFATYDLGRPMFDFPPEYRRGERLRVKLVESLGPSLLDIPMYSGIQKAEITDDGELAFSEPLGDRVVSFASEMLPPIVLSRVRPVYRHLVESEEFVSQYDELHECYLKQIDESQLTAESFDLEAFSSDIRWMAMLAQYVHAVEHLGYDGTRSRE